MLTLEVPASIWIVVIILLGLFIIEGFYLAKRQKSMTDYYVAGFRIPPWALGIALAATVMSGWGYVGGPGSFYAHGFQIMLIIEICVLLGYGLSYLLLSRPMRELAETHGALTVPDLGEILYGSKHLRFALSVGIILGVIGYLTAQYTAMGMVLSMIFPISPTVGITIGMIIIVGYCVLGGHEAAIWTSTWQGIVMVGASFLFIGSVIKIGGFEHMFTTLNTKVSPNFASLGAVPIQQWISYIMIFTLGMCALPHSITKFYTISKKEFLIVALIATLIFDSVMVMFEFSGTLTKYGVLELGWPEPPKPDMAVGVFVLKMFPNLLGGVIFGAMVAAILSTADSFLILASSSFARDIYQQWLWPLYIKKEKYAFNELKLARIATAVIGVLVYFFALGQVTMIVFLGILGWSLFVCTILVPINAGLFWKKANKGGAIAATWVGIVTCGVLGLSEILYKSNFWLSAGAWGIIASAIAFLIGNYIYSQRTQKNIEMKVASA